MTKDKIREFFTRLRAANPEPKGELEWRNPFTLLVAVALSAQATDKSVNKATPALFGRADTPEKMMQLGEERIRDCIKTIGLYNSKAKNVLALSKILVEQYGGVVPADRDELVKLPGVGRKTANVVLNMAFGQPTMAVDTRDMHDEMDRERDGFTGTAMRKSDVGREHTMRQPRERLLSGVRMDRAQAAEMSGVQRLQQVECLGAADFADQNAIGPMTKGGSEKICNRHRRQGRLLPQRRLRTSRFEPKHVRFVQMDLGGFFNDDDAIAFGNVRRERVQQRRFSGAGPAGDQDVLLRRHRGDQLRREGRSERPNINQVLQAVAPRELANRQHRSSDRARGKHRRDPRPVLETRVEQGLHLRDLVATCPSDVLDRNGKVPRFKRAPGNCLNRAVTLDENAPAALVHHYLGDIGIEQQILDRFEERQNAIQAAHSAPRAT